MIKLAFITPTEYIQRFGKKGDFILALANLLELDKENEYEKAIKKTKLPILLDNGLFENHTPEPLESLIEKAVKVGAELFFAPDVLCKAEETKKELKKAIKAAELSNLKIGAVVQANNKEDYIKQLIEFNNNEGVDLIGLSILSIPKCFGGEITESRIKLMLKMIELKRDKGIEWKNCHLLGIGDSYQDVIFAKLNCPWIISNDSSSAFQTALYNCSYDGELKVAQGKVQEKVNFELKSVPENVLQDIERNIRIIKEKIQCN